MKHRILFYQPSFLLLTVTQYLAAHTSHITLPKITTNTTTPTSVSKVRRLNDESRVHNDIFNKSRTSHPRQGQVEVKFKFWLISVVDFDINMESIVIMAWVTQKWNNPVLRWNPRDYGGVSRINIRSTETWTPDIYAYGNVEAQFRYNGLLNNLQTQVLLFFFVVRVDLHQVTQS